MKKLISCFLILVICIMAVSCAAEPINNTTETTAKTDNVTKTTEPENEDYWVVDYFVDEFNQPTDERYIKNNTDIIGQFSNSATTNSKLKVYTLVSDTVAFMLLEYGRSIVKNNGSNNEYYDISVRKADGSTITMEGALLAGSDRVTVKDSDVSTFISLLKGDDDFQVFLQSERFTTTTYLFTVSPANFSQIY